MESKPRDFSDKMQRLFMRRTADVYRHMCDRVAEKKNKRGQIIRRGREIPYSLEQFRTFVRGHFPPDPYNAWETNCRYCSGIVSLGRVVWDHEVPLARGGALGLSNLVACCSDCNSVKGKLVAAEFRALMEGLRTFPEAARNDILGRLRGQMRWMGNRPKQKPTEVTKCLT